QIKKHRKTRVKTTRNQNFLNYVKKEVPENKLPELEDQEFPKIEQRIKRLLLYEIQVLIKYKKQIQAITEPL
ncbi:37112_t:CDS:1, partial [Gigaspora margarita]